MEEVAEAEGGSENGCMPAVVEVVEEGAAPSNASASSPSIHSSPASSAVTVGAAEAEAEREVEAERAEAEAEEEEGVVRRAEAVRERRIPPPAESGREGEGAAVKVGVRVEVAGGSSTE